MKELKIALLISFIILIIAFIGIFFRKPVVIKEKIQQTPSENKIFEGHFLGLEEAKPIVLFEDYQCPYCRKFFTEVESKLYEEFIKVGKVKLIVKNFPILGPESYKAALAAECASEQGKFWEYRQMLYDNQFGQNLGVFSDKNLIKFAKNLNLNEELFSQCLLNEKYKNKIEEERNIGFSLKISGTPAFWINGEVYVGFLNYDKIKELIAE